MIESLFGELLPDKLIQKLFPYPSKSHRVRLRFSSSFNDSLPLEELQDLILEDGIIITACVVQPEERPGYIVSV